MHRENSDWRTDQTPLHEARRRLREAEIRFAQHQVMLTELLAEGRHDPQLQHQMLLIAASYDVLVKKIETMASATANTPECNSRSASRQSLGPEPG